MPSHVVEGLYLLEGPFYWFAFSAKAAVVYYSAFTQFRALLVKQAELHRDI